MDRFLRIGLVSLSVLTLGASPDSFSRKDLDALERERRVAEEKLAAMEAASSTTRSDLDGLEKQLIAAAMESQRREEEAAAAELRLIDLRARLTAAEATLLADGAALEDLLGILASSGRRQPPALVVSPERVNLAVRRAIVTSDAAPKLAERTQTLSEEIDRLNALEFDIRREKARLDAAEAVLALKEAEILELTSVKRASYGDVSAETEALRVEVAGIARRAETLRELLAGLEADAPPSPGVKPDLRPKLAALDPNLSGTMTDANPEPAIPRALQPLGEKALGNLARPAAGFIKRGFGDRMPGGGKSMGLAIETRGGAQVAAPVDGRIDYAGPFRSYGQMLILRTSDGYHIILSGLGDLRGVTGDTVKAGEPVGRMPGRSDPPPELYVELRREGAPMDPADWMKRGR